MNEEFKEILKKLEGVKCDPTIFSHLQERIAREDIIRKECHKLGVSIDEFHYWVLNNAY